MNPSPASSYRTSTELNVEMSAAVIRVLLYFDIFNHPLSINEIKDLIQIEVKDENEVAEVLLELVDQQKIYFHEGYYSVSSSVFNMHRRIAGEKYAKTMVDRMKKFSSLIASFPFVKAVTISGSLSKNFMDENSDIDYFIITSRNRLWLTRTFLVLYKKLFLLNSKKNFCVNYFVSEDQLAIPDRNIFTATEVSYLIPVYNYSEYLNFMKENKWSKTFYPNFPLRSEYYLIDEKFPGIKSFLEKIFSGSLGEAIDNYFFKFTLKHWKKKFKDFDASTFDLRMRTKKNVSKHHPNGFQEKILRELDIKFSNFEKQHDIVLRHEKSSVYA
ncbi:MAG: hypothetical protein IPL24_11445 [Bacteroidetes bacterium]|nr:hypothetical protein [Bacteroidota bacterium]